MIISDPSQLKRMNPSQKIKYIKCSALIDTNALIIYILDMYRANHNNKDYTLKNCDIEENQVTALNLIIDSFKIEYFIITPHILSEFINRLRNKLKGDHKQIEEEFMDKLISLDEIPINKNDILKHKKFLDFGNDISILIASHKKLKEIKNLNLISFDSAFINEFYNKQQNILAFDMNVLRYTLSY